MERVSPQPAFDAPGRRKSVFAEVGLVDEATIRTERSPAPTSLLKPRKKRFRPSRIVRFRSRHEIFEESDEDAHSGSESTDDSTDCDVITTQSRTNSTNFMLYRAGLLALILAIMLPILQIKPTSLIGVKGGAIPRRSIDSVEVLKREDTDTNICKRWAHQCKYG